jgi:hypothetical protein
MEHQITWFVFGSVAMGAALSGWVALSIWETVKGRAKLGKKHGEELETKQHQLQTGQELLGTNTGPVDDVTKDLLWGMFQEHLNTARHHEDQREKVTSLFLVLETALLGLLALKKGEIGVFHPYYVTLPVIGIALFGALFSLKHYERYRFHTAVAGQYRRQLERLIPTVHLGLAFLDTKREHNSTFRFQSRSHLYLHWTVLHLSVAVLGMIFTIVIPAPAPGINRSSLAVVFGACFLITLLCSSAWMRWRPRNAL